MRTILASAVILATLASCFPYVTSYVHLEAAGVSHLSSACRDVGPPVFATYEANGASFRVTLEPGWASHSKAGFLMVRAPDNMVVSIPEPIGYLRRNDKPDQPALPFNLRKSDNYENRYGAEILERGGLVDHRFSFVGLPPIEFSGILTLPTVYVNNTAVTSPSFTFERRSHAGVAPLNC
jgi:hypothetical protein